MPDTESTTSTPAEPTDAELAAANAVIARKAMADAAKADEQKAPLRDWVGSADFAAFYDKAEEMRGTFESGSPFYVHLNALIVVMTNLRNDIDA